MTTFDDRLAAQMRVLDAAIPTPITPPMDLVQTRRRRFPMRRLVVLAAAVAVLGGATGTILSLYGGLGGDAYQYAWQHATTLALRQTDQGYMVTLEAAYADQARLTLAISALDTQNRGWSGIDAGSASARFADGSGPVYMMTSGGSTPASMGSANTVWLDAAEPPSPGVHRMVVTVPAIRYRDPEPVGSTDPWHEVLGSWTFTFDLPVVGGRRVDVSATATANNVTATAIDLFATPTTVKIDVRWSNRGATFSSWTSVGTVYHDGHEMPIGGTETASDVETLRLISGTSDPSGHWKVVIDETIENGPNGDQVRLQGPWVLEFDVPRG